MNDFVTAIIKAKDWSVIIIFGEGILFLNHSDSQYDIVLWSCFSDNMCPTAN